MTSLTGVNGIWTSHRTPAFIVSVGVSAPRVLHEHRVLVHLAGPPALAEKLVLIGFGIERGLPVTDVDAADEHARRARARRSAAPADAPGKLVVGEHAQLAGSRRVDARTRCPAPSAARPPRRCRRRATCRSSGCGCPSASSACCRCSSSRRSAQSGCSATCQFVEVQAIRVGSLAIEIERRSRRCPRTSADRCSPAGRTSRDPSVMPPRSSLTMFGPSVERSATDAERPIRHVLAVVRRAGEPDVGAVQMIRIADDRPASCRRRSADGSSSRL